MSFQVILAYRFTLPGKKCRALKFEVSSFYSNPNKSSNGNVFEWYFTDYAVSVNLHMYKNSYVFVSYLTLSIPDIVRSAPSVMDGTRARRTIIYKSVL